MIKKSLELDYPIKVLPILQCSYAEIMLYDWLKK